MSDRYCLQMVSCGDGCCGNGGSKAENVYSTEENVCGTWIDGKPIYRKVIPGALANDNGNGYLFKNVSELNIDRVINLYGNLTDNANIAQVMLQTSYNRTDGLFGAVNVFYDTTTGNINYHLFNNKGYYSGTTVYVVIEYTKQ